VIDYTVLPAVNAALNATAAVLLAAGYHAIHRKRVVRHAALMIASVVVSTVFLASYITYHTLKHMHEGQAHTVFTGTGPLRAIYRAILFSHVILAVMTVPLVAITLYHAMRFRFDRHVRIARWTFPIWMYVSVSGVIVYVMLYHLR